MFCFVFLRGLLVFVCLFLVCFLRTGWEKSSNCSLEYSIKPTVSSRALAHNFLRAFFMLC